MLQQYVLMPCWARAVIATMHSFDAVTMHSEVVIMMVVTTPAVIELLCNVMLALCAEACSSRDDVQDERIITSAAQLEYLCVSVLMERPTIMRNTRELDTITYAVSVQPQFHRHEVLLK